MVFLPQMLLIGASNRNTGKTVVACESICTISKIVPVYAAKVIIIKELNGKCQRGEDNCRICTSLKEPFDITEEKQISNKDTSKMLQSGATSSFLIRSLKEYIGEAVQHFIQQIPKKGIIVCESNSLRNFIDPGLFLFVHDNSKPMKLSAKNVAHLADITLDNKNMKDISKHLTIEQYPECDTIKWL